MSRELGPGEAGAADEDLPRSEVQTYFLAIEKFFIELRGTPLMLSRKDYEVARQWHEEGIPLDLVERTVRELFERRAAHRAAEGEDKKRDQVLSLRYFRRSVAAAWKRHRELRAPAATDQAPRLDLTARLGRLADVLPENLEGRDEWIRRVAELADVGETEAVEKALSDLDAELLAAARESLDAASQERLQEDLDRSLAVLARRLPAEELELSKASLEERLLRQHLALPLLSIFSDAAEDEEGEV